ncbi:AmmeMemoRadiSam system radical SAM enzyme [Desulfosoma sp.]|uniref:AmmeMemoRadiSam system radical SAM enzyme n=1 Tax=Desulfosoma sp. TaxID=2603217 RepID=UPI004049442C
MDRRTFCCTLLRGTVWATLSWCTDAFRQPSRAWALSFQKGFMQPKASPYFTPLGNRRIRCTLCPRECEVDPGERGYWEVRENRDGVYYSLVYGNPCAVHVDPAEKKPFFHVLPGSRSFSLATAGCNLDCKFCQNWEISQARPENTLNAALSPEDVVALALRSRCDSIASTYVEPTIFFEYMKDIGILASQAGILNVMHSNGFVNSQPLNDLIPYLHAACIDLKSIRDDYYRDMTEGFVGPVLSTLKELKKHRVHTEVMTLLVPGRNDSEKDLRDLSRWVLHALGEDTPVHFSRFYPRYKLQSLPPTPVATLEKARDIAMGEGLRYVYLGNVPGHPGEHTYCPKCGTVVIERTGYAVRLQAFNKGHCTRCGTSLPGLWTNPLKPAEGSVR